jgi:hypothetical protein
MNVEGTLLKSVVKIKILKATQNTTKTYTGKGY